jgi:hypothetical protein
LLFLVALGVVTSFAAYGYRAQIPWMDEFSVRSLARAWNLLEACVFENFQQVTDLLWHHLAYLFD